MRYKNIITAFAFALPASIAIRIFQTLYTIDITTGFFKPEYKKIGFYMILAIFFFTAIAVVSSLTTHRNPEKPPKGNIFMSVSSIWFAVMIIIELFTDKFSSFVRQWQSALLVLTGACCAAFFIIYGISLIVNVKIKKELYIIPTLYFMARVICSFTSISSLALITDNILIMAVYCMALMFMLDFAKIYNKIDASANYKKVLASGLASTILCFTQSVPYFIMNILNKNTYVHTSMSTNITIFALGLFICVFTLSYFSFNNVAKRKRHLSRNHDKKTDRFYM